MRCDQIREAASARLDAEPIGLPEALVDRHLAACADCARWLSEATKLNRVARIGSAAVPDLTDEILAAAPTGHRARRQPVAIALGTVALVQITLAAPALFGHSVEMSMALHSSHESAAFNIAIAIGLLDAARRPGRAAALLPVVATLVGLLTVLCARDLAAGAVSLGRLATHVTMLAGLGLLATLHRVDRRPPLPSLAHASAEADHTLRDVA